MRKGQWASYPALVPTGPPLCWTGRDQSETGRRLR